MNKYKQIKKADNWKDEAAGWAKWQVSIPKCAQCGETNTSYSVSGTENDIKELAANPEMDVCDKCC